MGRTGRSSCAAWMCCVRQDHPFELSSPMGVDDSRIPGESSLHLDYRGQRERSRAKCSLSVAREHIPKPSHNPFENVYVESSTRSGGRRSRRLVGDLLRRSQISCSVRTPNDEKKSPLLNSNCAKSTCGSESMPAVPRRMIDCSRT